MRRTNLVGWIRARAGSLRRQFALVLAIVVAPVLVALVVGDALMVVSGRGVLLVVGIVAAAGLVAAIAARLVVGGIMSDVQAIRTGLMAVGRGRRDVKIETTAHDELAELAAAANVPFVSLEYQPKCRDFAASIGWEQFVVRTDKISPNGLIDLVAVLIEQLEPRRTALCRQMCLIMEGFEGYCDEIETFWSASG